LQRGGGVDGWTEDMTDWIGLMNKAQDRDRHRMDGLMDWWHREITWLETNLLQCTLTSLFLLLFSLCYSKKYHQVFHWYLKLSAVPSDCLPPLMRMVCDKNTRYVFDTCLSWYEGLLWKSRNILQKNTAKGTLHWDFSFKMNITKYKALNSN